MIARSTALLLGLFAVCAPISVALGNISAALVLLTGVGLFTFSPDHRRHLPPRNILLAMGALFLTHLLATALSAPAPVQWHKFPEEMWFKLFLITVPLLAAGRPRVIEKVMGALLLAGAVAAAYAVAQFFTGQDLVRDRTLHSTMGYYIATSFHGHHLSYGGQVMLVFVVAVAWLRQTLLGNPRRLWAPLLLCLLLGFGLIFSFARSAQLGALAGSIYLVLTLPRTWRRWGVGLMLVMMVATMAVPMVRHRIVEGFTDEKEVTRPNLWRSSLAGIADRPLRGWGQGNFDKMMEQHEVPGFYESRAHSHNDYLMHAVNAGLPGLAAALWLLVAVLVYLHTGWRRAGSGSWVVSGAAGAQIAVAVAGFFQVFQTDDEPEMMLYFILGCGVAHLLGTRSAADQFSA